MKGTNKSNIQKIAIVLFTALILFNFIMPNLSIAATQELTDAYRWKVPKESDKGNYDWNLEDEKITGSERDTVINQICMPYMIPDPNTGTWGPNPLKSTEYAAAYASATSYIDAYNSRLETAKTNGESLYDAINYANGDAVKDANEAFQEEKEKIEAAEAAEAEEEGGEDDIGGVLFRPIASLICGIGDTFNKLLQILLIDDKSDVFISRRIFLRF